MVPLIKAPLELKKIIIKKKHFNFWKGNSKDKLNAGETNSLFYGEVFTPLEILIQLRRLIKAINLNFPLTSLRFQSKKCCIDSFQNSCDLDYW